MATECSIEVITFPQYTAQWPGQVGGFGRFAAVRRSVGPYREHTPVWTTEGPPSTTSGDIVTRFDFVRLHGDIKIYLQLGEA